MTLPITLHDSFKTTDTRHVICDKKKKRKRNVKTKWINDGKNK